MKKIAVLGSTGSIGVNALKVISRYPEKFKVVALSCDTNYRLLARQARRFKPRMVGIKDVSKIKDLKRSLGSVKTRIFAGAEGLAEMAKSTDAHIVLIGISGNASLLPLVSAIDAKKDIALASKEPLVSAGEIVMKKARENGVKIIPVDSEHSAVFQCLRGRDENDLRKIYLTGTGGPLRSIRESLFDKIPRAKMVIHPKWKMGKKISVDSATLMNKGLEVIEARWLFNIPIDRISVLIHPEAIVHSMVEFLDGAILAQLAVPDMKLPILYALSFPDRLHSNSFDMDLGRMGRLSFHQPNVKKFPCLSLAFDTWRKGNSYPAVLNAANEEAVKAYLRGKINFTHIPRVIERALTAHKVVKKPELIDVIYADNWAREEAARVIERL